MRRDAEPVHVVTQFGNFVTNERTEIASAATLYVTSLADVIIRSQQRRCLELATERRIQFSSVTPYIELNYVQFSSVGRCMAALT